MKTQLLIFVIVCLFSLAYIIMTISVFITPCDAKYRVMFLMGSLVPILLTRETWRELKSEMNCYNKTILYKNEQENRR